MCSTCASLAAVGCGLVGDPEVPALTALRYAGQAADSPLVLLIEADFEDDDGDLSSGDLETFINQQVTSAGRLSLMPIFLQSGLDVGARQGTLEFVLELSFANGPPPVGTSFALGARVTDGAGNTSVLEEITLKLEE